MSLWTNLPRRLERQGVAQGGLSVEIKVEVNDVARGKAGVSVSFRVGLRPHDSRRSLQGMSNAGVVAWQGSEGIIAGERNVAGARGSRHWAEGEVQ